MRDAEIVSWLNFQTLVILSEAKDLCIWRAARVFLADSGGPSRQTTPPQDDNRFHDQGLGLSANARRRP